MPQQSDQDLQQQRVAQLPIKSPLSLAFMTNLLEQTRHCRIALRHHFGSSQQRIVQTPVAHQKLDVQRPHQPTRMEAMLLFRFQ
jgi:hypothetical protein